MAAPAAAAATAAATSATPKHPSPDAVTSAATGASSEAPSSVARNDVSTGAASPEVAAGLGTTVASLPWGARENSVGLNAKAAGRSSSNNDNDNSSSSSSSKNNSTAASTGARNEGSTGEEIAGRGDVPSEIPGTTSRKHGGEQRQGEAREQHISEQPVDHGNKRQLHHRRLVPRNRGGGSVPPEVGRQIRLRQQERPRQRQHQQHQDHHDRQQNCQQPLRLGPQQQQQHQHATKGPIGPRQASGEQLSAQQPMVASLLHQERQQRRLREWQWQQQRDLQQKQYRQQQQLLQLQKQQLETLQSLQQQHQRRQQQQHKQQQQQQRQCREEHNTNLYVQPSGAASGARSGHAPPMADVVDLSATLSPSTRQPPPEASVPSRMLSPLQLGGAPYNMFPRSGSGSDSDSIDGISSDSSGSGSSGEASSSPLHLQEQLGRALNALRNVHIQAWYEANGSRQTIHSLERKLEAAKSEVSRVKATMHVDYDVTAAAAAAPPSLDAPPPGEDHRRHPEREAVAAVASAPESTPKMPPDVAMDLGATAAVRTERTSAGRTFPRDVGKQEGRAETSGGGAFSAPYSSDEKEGGAVSTRGTTAPPVVTALSPAVQPRRQYFSLRSDAAAADDDDDDDGSAATAGAGAGPVAKNPLRESLRREKRRQRKQHKDYNSSRENEFKALDSPQTAAVPSADSAPSSKGPSKSRSNSLPSEADAVAASTAGTVAGNDGKHKRRRESQLPPSSLFSPPSSARGGGGGGGSGGGGNGGGDERRGYRAGLETMAVESTEPAEAGEGHQIHYQRDDNAAVLEREVKRAKKSMEAEHAVLLADRDTTISQLSGEVTKRTDENALLLVALDSAVKEMASRLSSKDMEIQDARSELESAKHHFHRQYQQHQQQQQRQRQQHQEQQQQLQQQRQHLQPQQQQRQHQQQGQVVRGVVGDKSARSGSVAGGPTSVRTSPAPCDASAQASAWAPMTARGRRGTGTGPRRDVLQLNITLARQRQQQLQHLKALQQR